MDEQNHSEIEAVRQALAEERALRQALEADLQRSAQIGQELLLKNEELEQVVKEQAEKTTPATRRKSSADVAVVPAIRRACTMPVGPKEAMMDDADEDESDGDGDIIPKPRAPLRRGRAGKTVMVEELMSANQTLHEDLMRLKHEQRRHRNRKTTATEEDIQNMDDMDEGASDKELQFKVAELESERRQLQRELFESQEKAAKALQFEEELEATRSSLTRAQKQLAVLEEKNRSLRTSQQAIDAERAKLANLLEAADSRCAHLEQELEQTMLARARSRTATGSIWPAASEAASETLGDSLASELAQDGQEVHQEALQSDCMKLATELRVEVGALNRATASCKAWLMAARKLCDEKPVAPTAPFADGRSDDETSP